MSRSTVWLLDVNLLIALTHAAHVHHADAPEPLQLSTLQSAVLVGHRQVTNAYLLGLAALRKQRVATLDRGLVSFAQAAGLASRVELAAERPSSVQQPAARYAVKRSGR